MSSSRNDYYLLLENYLPDNGSQLISPQDIKTVLVDLVDSIPNFITDRELDTTNIGGFDYRNTRIGDLALYYSYTNPLTYNEDNTGLGYSALRANYSGIRNTAVGSYALGCSLYGSENAAVGFLSCGGNLDGSGNVAIGNYTLVTNKYGDFNIAIGHGAGNSVNPSSEYKFYVGAAPISVECSGTSFPHLMYGDLKSLRLAIGSENTLHELATLQVSGNASPLVDTSGNLGHPYMQWGEAFIASGLNYSEDQNFVISKTNRTAPSGFSLEKVATFSSGNKIAFGDTLPSGDFGLVTVAGNIIPSQDKEYSLGAPDLKWNGFFGNIIVSGTAIINDLEYTTKTECLYNCKTLHLATSGLCPDDIFNSTVCGYLSDEGLDGAGFEIHSSGATYLRDYRFIYRFPDQTLSCLETDSNYARSRWESNISIAVSSGNHIQTQRVLSKDNLSLVSQQNCFGAFIRENERFTVGNQALISSGTDFVNFVRPSGFSISRIAHGANVTVTDRFLSRNKTRGFDLSYIDANDVSASGQVLDRFIIRAVDDVNRDAIVVLRSGVGTVGISNFHGAIPQTIFNVQSSSGCDARFTSSSYGKVNLQMLVNNNIPASGFEISYFPTVGLVGNTPDTIDQNKPIIHFSMFTPSGSQVFKKTAMSIAANNFIGIGTTRLGENALFSPNSPLTISHSGSISGTIAMASQSISPAPTVGFGKIYVKPSGFLTQTQCLYFKDDNNTELRISPHINEEFLYADENGNTYAGKTPVFKPLSNNVTFNTAIGYRALYSLNIGSGNVSIAAAENLSNGNSNVFIGRNTASGISSANRNVVVGAQQFNFQAGGNNNIIIGIENANNLVSQLNNAILIGSGLNTNLSDYSLNIGYNSDPVLTGSLGGGSRNLNVRNASLSIWSELNDQELKIVHNKRNNRYVSNLIVKDSINSDENDGFLSIQFADANNFTRTLVDFDFNAPIYSIPHNFTAPDPVRPFVGISGDINVLGAIRFADGTYLESATVINGTLNFCNLPDALSLSNDFNTQNSYLALSVPSGASCAPGKISLQSLSDFVGSGFASVSNNCNFVWSNAESSIDKVKNSNSVFVGCNVATAATGWKHSVFIGSNAGTNAQTPNVGLATDTANICIGYNSGADSDNTANLISIGTNAAYAASGSQRSIYIGSNAGMDHNGNDCIGIGFHALRGDSSVQNGVNNIEIVAGLLNNQRLMHGSGNLSNRLNIQNTIAGDTENKRISIGHATLNPDSVLSVRKNNIIPGHASINYIQSWWCDNVRVAAIDCNGNFITSPTNENALTIEGVMTQPIVAPIDPSSPNSGIMTIKDASWNSIGTVHIVNKDPTLNIPNCAYVVATKINGTYRPTWVSCTGVC